MYDWIYENRTNTLHQITHMHFDFTTPKRPKIDENKKKRKEKSRKREIRERSGKKGLASLLIFISSTLARKKSA